MNEYEVLYDIKNKIENKIKENNLFKMQRDKAYFLVIEKFGVISSLILFNKNEEQIQKFLKSKIGTNATYIETTDFFQESLKWLFRWCSMYCSENDDNDIKIVADDVFELMGIAYSYDLFYNMWHFNSKHLVKYKKYENKIEFDYIFEESYKVHYCYDAYINGLKDKNLYNELELLEFREKETNKERMMENAHLSDFDCGINFDFRDFDLAEYINFSNELNKIVTNKMFLPVRMIIPGEEGIICLSKDFWIDLLTSKTGYNKKLIRSMIDFFTYNKEDEDSDISLTYFLPYKKDYLLLCEMIYFLQRPEKNALRVLVKSDSREYQRDQNYFENIQKQKISSKINEHYIYSINIEKEKKIRPGMDWLVYDKYTNHLQVIEFKYRIPTESPKDILHLDEGLNKGYKQLEEAKKYVNSNLNSILSEYFGEEYLNVVPEEIDYFVLTNDSIGTGNKKMLPTPILNEFHYVSLMQKNNGMILVREALLDDRKTIIKSFKKRYSRFSIVGFKVLLPEYWFK